MQTLTKREDLIRLKVLGLIQHDSEDVLPYDTLRFERVSPSKIKMLIDFGLCDPEDAQNFSPSIQQLLDFIDKVKDLSDRDKFSLSGYVVSPDNRDDCRVSIDQIECNSITDLNPETIIDFANSFHHADDFGVCLVDLYAWWD